MAVREDAAEIGFDDKYIYDVTKCIVEQKKVDLEQIERDTCLGIAEWKTKEDKVQY